MSPHSGESAVRRAQRLLRWYPAGWQSRYGDEFTELLIADIRERPRSRARTFDVARGGVVARLSGAGLCGCAPDPGQQVRSSLASLACCLAVFAGFGSALWSQLAIGWQWSEPARGAAVAMVVTSVAMLAFGALVLAAALPVVVSVAARIASRRSKGLNAPSVACLAGLVIVVIGSRHFGNGWPGTGGHPWGHQGLVPAGVAAFSWAATMWVSSYWAHPAALGAFPLAQLTWMAVSPLALTCLAGGAAVLIRRTEFSPRMLRFETRLGVAACLIMAVFVVGCCPWVLSRGAGSGSLFHPGTVGAVTLAVMAVALAVAHRAAGQARRAGFRLAAR